MGAADRLVGRSHACDHPPGVERLPALTAPKHPTDGTSYEIDERLRALLQEGLGVYRVDAERLRELEPDVILTQTQCDVCAASLADVEEALRSWVGGDPELVALAPNRLADVWEDVRRVARALDVPERGEAVVRELESRVEEVAGRARGGSHRPRVACVEWLDPLMAAGNWVPELVELAGGESVFGAAGEHSPWLEWEALREADPDVIVLMPCGFDIGKTMAEADSLRRRPGWPELRAVREGRVYVVDGHQYFNRPGPRLVESLEILAEILTGGAAVHRGIGWRPVAAEVT